MKNKLKKYIENIFSSLDTATEFEIYDCRLDILPLWATKIQCTHQYLVCTSKNVGIQKLAAFIKRDVYKTENYIYWFEGEQIVDHTEHIKVDEKNIVEELRNKIYLPSWLDKFIFSELKAEYAPDCNKFEHNLKIKNKEILNYLGTYFPRSFTEAYCIFENILKNRKYHQLLLQKKALNILSVGCGTGGDVLGLLTILKEHIHFEDITICVIDGNEEALFILEKIIQRFEKEFNKKVYLKVVENTFNYISEKEIKTNQLFDFILCFKMINELISVGQGANDNSYYDFVKKFLPILSEEGICLLLDVTTKQKHNNVYNPMLMNEQINRALKEMDDYRTLLPLSCATYGNSCVSSDCFSQKIFFVSHQQKKNDKSKVYYKAITRNSLWRIIGKRIEHKKLQIHPDKYCTFTLQYYEEQDAYEL